MNAPERRFAGHTAAEANQYRAEALARLRAYKSVTCTAERWDRMLALLELASENLKHTECRDGDASRCPACGLESEIETMLKEARHAS